MIEEHIELENNMAVVGERIEKIRLALDLKKIDMATALGFRYPFLSKIIKGEKKLNIEHVTKLYNAYNVSPNYVLLGIGDMFVSKSGRSENASKVGTWVQGKIDALFEHTTKDVKFARKLANAYVRFLDGNDLTL